MSGAAGAAALTAQPIVPAESVAANVVPSEAIHLLQRKTYDQAPPLTYVPAGMGVCVKLPVASRGEPYLLVAVSL